MRRFAAILIWQQVRPSRASWFTWESTSLGIAGSIAIGVALAAALRAVVLNLRPTRVARAFGAAGGVSAA